MILGLEEGAQRHGNRELIRWASDGTSTSWAELALSAGRWATLLEELGVVPGDRVVLLLGNSREFLGAYFGAQFLGALSVPVNTELRGQSLQHPLALYEPRVVVIEPELGDVTASAALAVGTAPRVVIAGSLDLSALDPRPARSARDSDDCVIMSTSGTTGPSKGTIWNHGTVQQWARGWERHLAYGPDDRIYSSTPLFHANSLMSAVATAQHIGGAAVLGERFSVSRFWAEVADNGATSATVLGSMIDLLLRDESPARAADRARSSLRTMLASSVSAAAQRAVQRDWGVTPITAYGLTDFGSVLSTTFGEPAPAGTAGKPVAEFEIRLVDSEDQDVPAGQPGEAILRSRVPWCAPQEYFGMPEETVASRRNLWFHTGDLLRQDADGWFYFAGRVKDSMRRRGENVSAFEVEAAAMTFDSIVDVAAYAVPSDESEDEIAVAVVLAPSVDDLDRARFMEHLAGQLPYFAVPRYVRVVPQLPRTPTQKVKKADLREEGLSAAGTWDRVAAGFEISRNR